MGIYELGHCVLLFLPTAIANGWYDVIIDDCICDIG